MNIKLFGRFGIWWVLLAPIALSACGAFEVARSQCLAEAGTVYQHFLCQYLPAIGSGASISATAATPSPSDVASVRVGAVSAYATILIGVIATLIGIEALIDKLRVAHRRVLTMDCDVFVRGVDRELRAILTNPGRGTVRMRNITVTDGAALIMPHPDLQIDSGSQVEWTVLAAHTPLPSLIIVQGEFDRADGSGWRFEAEFAITAGISEARRLDLSKR